MRVRRKTYNGSVFESTGFLCGSRSEVGIKDQVGNMYSTLASELEVWVERLGAWKDLKTAIGDLDVMVSSCCGALSEPGRDRPIGKL